MIGRTEEPVKKLHLISMLVLIAILAACGPAPVALATPTFAPLPDPTPTPIPPTETPVPPTPTPEPTPTPAYPPEGIGPASYPEGVNPLTGLPVANPALLERRPILMKVSNLPRSVRPQWGLSRADIVYEYYTEEGTTRFAAVFLGQDAEQVGSIRSARFFDDKLIRMYKAVFAFGSADERVRWRLFTADYANRLVLEWTAGCPALCRVDPGGYDFLVGNTAEISAYITRKGVPNGRQDLSGMFFQLQPPEGGTPVQHIYTRYSGSIYNRWDYDPLAGRYLRYADTVDDFQGSGEVYAPLTDRLTGEAITADTLVVVLIPHFYFLYTPEIIDMQFGRSGPAYVFRDGLLYQVYWSRPSESSVLSLTWPDGRPFPFKPGVTWFEVMGTSSRIEQLADGSWKFRFGIP